LAEQLETLAVIAPLEAVYIEDENGETTRLRVERETLTDGSEVNLVLAAQVTTAQSRGRPLPMPVSRSQMSSLLCES
jgi:hypothetical protein